MNKETTEIGEMVIHDAKVIFRKLGCEDDFCIQAVGYNAVFGGTNRLLFSPLIGFRPDPDYCTNKFLSNWEKYYSFK